MKRFPPLLHPITPSPDSSSSRAVAMLCLHVIPGFGQSFSYVFSDHYRTMLSAGTPKSDCQVALAFADVVRHEVNEQVRNAVDELLRLRKLPNIRCNLRMLAR